MAVISLVAATFAIYAVQELIVVREARLFGERAQAKGFHCRTEVHPTLGKNFAITLETDKNLLYHIGVLTGYGEKAVHPSKITLIDQAGKSIPVEFQNTPFGSELKLHPLSNGQKQLQFDMSTKTTYSVVICANYSSLYHTDEKDRVIDDHSHF